MRFMVCSIRECRTPRLHQPAAGPAGARARGRAAIWKSWPTRRTARRSPHGCNPRRRAATRRPARCRRAGPVRARGRSHRRDPRCGARPTLGLPVLVQFLERASRAGQPALAAMPRRTQMHEAARNGDAADPARERAAPLELMQPRDDVDEDVLGHVLRRGARRHDATRQRTDRNFVGPVDFRERGFVAGAGAIEGGGVEGSVEKCGHSGG